MLLNNLKNLVKTYALLGYGRHYDGDLNYTDAWYPIIDTNGNEGTCFNVGGNTSYHDFFPFMNKYFSLCTSYSVSDDYTGLILGTGTTPVTENDYALESIITSGIAYNSSSLQKSIEKDPTQDKVTKKSILTYVVKNTGSSDLTVSEAGLLHRHFLQTGATNKTATVLLHREVFEEPVIIPVGGKRTFRFEFEFVTQLV